MSTPVRALILHDSLETAGLLIRELERGGFSPVFERVSSSEAFDRALGSGWDVILSDYRLENFSAVAALATLKERELDTPFVIISDNIGEETAVRAIKAGAHNCIPTAALGRLATTVEREIREVQIRRERRQARHALRESESRFRMLVETASDAILTVDDTGRILFANRAAERIFGYPMAAMIGENLTFLVPDCPPLAELVPLAPAESPDAAASSLQAELTGKHERGHAVPLDVSVGLLDRDGRMQLTIIARDATERKKADRALRDSEERLRTLVNNAPIVLFALDRDGVVTHLEGSGLEAAGLRPGEAVGRSTFELYHDYPKALDLLRRSLSGDAVQETFEVKDLVFDVELAPRRDPEGAVTGVIGVATNVTGQRQAERAADQSEMRYRLLFEGNLAGVYRTTLDGAILDCNDSFAQIFGYGSREEVLALPAWDLYPTAEDRKASIARLRERKSLTNYEECLRRKDGSHVWVLENGTLIEGTDGKPAMIEGTVIDITERKRAEEQVKHLAFHDSLTGLPNRLLFADRLRRGHGPREPLPGEAGRALPGHRPLQGHQRLARTLDRGRAPPARLRARGRVRPAGGTRSRASAGTSSRCCCRASSGEERRRHDRQQDPGGRPSPVLHRAAASSSSPPPSASPLYPDRRRRTRDPRPQRGHRDVPGEGAGARQLPALHARDELKRARTPLPREPAAPGAPQPGARPPLPAVIDLATGQIRGAEALLRWQHPELGLVMPGEFISLAEVSGLIVPIGEWVLRTACAQASAWQKNGYPHLRRREPLLSTVPAGRSRASRSAKRCSTRISPRRRSTWRSPSPTPCRTPSSRSPRSGT